MTRWANWMGATPGDWSKHNPSWTWSTDPSQCYSWYRCTSCTICALRSCPRRVPDCASAVIFCDGSPWKQLGKCPMVMIIFPLKTEMWLSKHFQWFTAVTFQWSFKSRCATHFCVTWHGAAAPQMYLAGFYFLLSIPCFAVWPLGGPRRRRYPRVMKMT